MVCKHFAHTDMQTWHVPPRRTHRAHPALPARSRFPGLNEEGPDKPPSPALAC